MNHTPYHDGVHAPPPVTETIHSTTITLNKRSFRNPQSPQKHMSSLSNNLSELDNLLQDLSSAQFIAEIDRRNNDTQRRPLPSPGDGKTVDHLLNELENFLPPNQPIYEQVQRKQAPAATTATRELDDLMASLSEFKPNKLKPVEEPVVAVAQNGPDLNSMMDNLQDDMNKQGVVIVPKGDCAKCSKPIVGQVVTALGRLWHPEHFTCAECQQELGTRSFFERDGKPYCERDYHNLFSPRCAHCEGPILDKCVTGLNKAWHPEHFVCAKCGKPFGEDGFHERDGKAYCRNDYLAMFAPKCGGCELPILEGYISALGRQWHNECFVCRDCHQPFNGASFYDHEGYPFCETHYHSKRGSLCAACVKPITGRCITAMYKKFHPEHFVCAFCLKQLNKGTFKEQNEKPYCHECFEKLFG